MPETTDLNTKVLILTNTKENLRIISIIFHLYSTQCRNLKQAGRKVLMVALTAVSFISSSFFVPQISSHSTTSYPSVIRSRKVKSKNIEDMDLQLIFKTLHPKSLDIDYIKENKYKINFSLFGFFVFQNRYMSSEPGVASFLVN